MTTQEETANDHPMALILMPPLLLGIQGAVKPYPTVAIGGRRSTCGALSGNRRLAAIVRVDPRHSSRLRLARSLLGVVTTATCAVGRDIPKVSAASATDRHASLTADPLPTMTGQWRAPSASFADVDGTAEPGSHSGTH
ncbi:MAG: hypothetical protein QOH09_3237 [Pseudonocardiales bacterium]|nr:hypothetical protein [Pseudonocardiales bacterium]